MFKISLNINPSNSVKAKVARIHYHAGRVDLPKRTSNNPKVTQKAHINRGYIFYHWKNIKIHVPVPKGNTKGLKSYTKETFYDNILITIII